MKECPACRTTYTDETLSYCLADGKLLVEIPDGPETIVNRAGEPTAIFGRGEKMRVEIPQETANMSPPAFVAAPPSGSGVKIFIGVFLVFLLLAVIVIAGGVAFYISNKDTGVTSKNTAANSTPTPAPSPTKDDKDELREEIANLEKRLNEQKKNDQSSNIPLTMPKQSSTTTTARVNSPSDGFLALRTLPSSEIGDRVLKIPHGATISIGACGPVVRPVNRSGRWCQASYDGYSGWVFDAYLSY